MIEEISFEEKETPSSKFITLREAVSNESMARSRVSLNVFVYPQKNNVEQNNFRVLKTIEFVVASALVAKHALISSLMQNN